MTVIEVRTMEIICHNLPEIAKQLKRIADELTFANQMKLNAKLGAEAKEDSNEPA